ncbi:MAG: DUF3822 family protein [Chitinophagaceae bacterium]|nr:DUF3822 family protein [Bacteroidota bacterium]MCC6257686.1 DUF3822 family protein [Chitinophagaceae bacterium]
MKPAFNISPSPGDQEGKNLLIEVGNYGVSFSWYRNNPNFLEGILVFNFDKFLTPSEWIGALNSMYRNYPVLGMPHHSIRVCINFPEFMLIPGEYYNPVNARELFSRTFQSGPEFEIITDVLKEEKIFMVYGVRKELYDFFQFHYPNWVMLHASVNEIRSWGKENSITCIIYHNAIKIIACRDGSFQYCGIFSFTKPVDVVYFLLKVCETYQLDPETIPLKLCGMVDEYSILYNEVYKYFGIVSFISENENFEMQERIRFYPNHFFCHHTIQISCAS